MPEVFTKMWNDESGQDLIEYALVAALIARGAVTSMQTVATSIGSAFTQIESQLSNALG